MHNLSKSDPKYTIYPSDWKQGLLAYFNMIKVRILVILEAEENTREKSSKWYTRQVIDITKEMNLRKDMLRFAVLRTASEHFLQSVRESAFVVITLQTWAVFFS